MSQLPAVSVSLTVKAELLSSFFLLLQQGVGVTARVGCTLDRLLERQWNLDPAYVAGRITTIFLDARAVDDVKTAVVREGSVVALSGAMPGLVGATMRRGGHLAAMRGAMTYRDGADSGGDRIAVVTLKLFNLLLPELAPVFLARGIVVKANVFRSFLRELQAPFWEGCSQLLVNNRAVPPASFAAADWLPSDGQVRLTVTLED